AFFLAFVAVAGVGRAHAQAPRGVVQAAIAEARTHLSAHRYAEAFAVCERAAATTPSAQLLRCMALARDGEGNVVEAERYATRALAVSNDPWLATHRADLEAMRAQWWPRLGRLDVRSSIEGAVLLVDGVAIGALPLAEAPVVTAGAHRVEVRAEGYVPY